MGLTKEARRLREAANDLASEHARLFFPVGHDGAAHCDCDMATRYRALIAEADEIGAKKMETCPTCGQSIRPARITHGPANEAEKGTR